MAKIRSSGRQSIPLTLAPSAGGGCIHRFCQVNRWTITSPKMPPKYVSNLIIFQYVQGIKQKKQLLTRTFLVAKRN